MRSSILLFILFSLIASCKKDDKTEFVEAKPVVSDYVSNCGYWLKIMGVNYAPINLPDQYKQSSGVAGNSNVIYISYTLLGDSLHCYDSVTFTTPPKRYDHIYPRIRIDKIL